MQKSEQPKFKSCRTGMPIMYMCMNEERIQEVNDFIDNLW